MIQRAMDAATDGLSQDELVGECPYNAVRLYQELQQREIQSVVIRGTLDNGIEGHWWVEAVIDGEWQCLDLACEVPDQRGSPLIGSRPVQYHPETINPDQMFVWYGKR